MRGRDVRRLGLSVCAGPAALFAFGLLLGAPAWGQSSVTTGPQGGAGSTPPGGVTASGQPMQMNGPPVGVADQIQQDFQPMGLQLGDTTVRPSMTVEALFDSNVYLTHSGSSDFAIIEKPSVVASRSEDQLSMQLSASAALAQYLRTNNDYDDFNVEGDAGYQFTDNLGAVLTLRRALMHLDRSSISSLGEQYGPVEFNLTTASIQPQFEADPFVDIAKLEWRYYDFLPQGPFDNQDLSNHQLYIGNRFGYQVTSLWTAFIEPSFELHRFIQTFDRNGIDHNENIYGILAGFNYTLPNDLYLELGVGYFWNRFENPNSHDFGGVSATGTATWNIDPLLTLSGTIGRSVSDVIDATTVSGSLTGATSEVTSAGSVRLDWRARHNILIFTGGSVAHDDFPSSPLIWNTLSATAGARYYFNNNLYSALQYTYSVRFSNDHTFDFNDNQIFLSLTGQL